jgi:hypothetical protein
MESAREGLQFHWTVADQVLQRHAVQILHRDEPLPIVVRNFVNGAYVGVVQSPSRTSFAAETFQGLQVLRDILGEKLECDKASE